MMRSILALAVAAALTACVSDGGEPARGDARAGQRFAQANCARCHAIGRHGDSPHGMAPPFRTLSQNYPLDALQEAFAEGVVVGHREMPQFQLSPKDIDDLVAYLKSVQERGWERTALRQSARITQYRQSDPPERLRSSAR